jgi:hypothetical protein
MNNSIKFFHPEETLEYNIQKGLCKTIWLESKNSIFVEIESTDDLEHVEEDSLQNGFPKVIFTLEDFPIEAESMTDLIGKELSIPVSFEEVQNKQGETVEVYYTNLSIFKDDFGTINNVVEINQITEGELFLKWKGECRDFIQESDENITFEVNFAIN